MHLISIKVVSRTELFFKYRIREKHHLMYVEYISMFKHRYKAEIQGGKVTRHTSKNLKAKYTVWL